MCQAREERHHKGRIYLGYSFSGYVLSFTCHLFATQSMKPTDHINWISTPMFQSLSQFSPSLGLTVEVKIYVTDDHNANPEEDWDDDSIHGSDEANSESRDSDETELESPISPVSRTATFVRHDSVSESEKPPKFSVKGEKRHHLSSSQGAEILNLSCVSTFVGRPDLGPILRNTVEGTVTGGEVSVHGMFNI